MWVHDIYNKNFIRMKDIRLLHIEESKLDGHGFNFLIRGYTYNEDNNISYILKRLPSKEEAIQWIEEAIKKDAEYGAK